MDAPKDYMNDEAFDNIFTSAIPGMEEMDQIFQHLVNRVLHFHSDMSLQPDALIDSNNSSLSYVASPRDQVLLKQPARDISPACSTTESFLNSQQSSLSSSVRYRSDGVSELKSNQ
jgi:hypothetical protein